MSVMPVSAGILAGVVTSIVLRVSKTPEATTQTATQNTPAQPTPTGMEGVVPEPMHDSVDFNALASRVRRLEENAADASGIALPSPEEMEAEDAQKWSSQLEAHKQEGRDGPWATHASTALTNDLSAILPASAQVIDVDCRTTTCAATIQWPSYADAHENAHRIVVGPFPSENCARTIHVPIPENPKAAYQSVMLFDCEAVRSGLTDETLPQ